MKLLLDRFLSIQQYSIANYGSKCISLNCQSVGRHTALCAFSEYGGISGLLE